MQQSTVPTVLSRALEPIGDCLTPNASRQLLAACDGSMNPADHTELSELLARNRDGQLDAAERPRLQSPMAE